MTDELGLLTRDAQGFLSTALGTGGSHLLSWRVEQVDYQPGGTTTVGYRARVRLRDGSTAEERMGACTGRIPDGAFVLDDGQTRVAVWRYPYDPDLPGLRAAHESRAGTAALDAAHSAGDVARVRVRAYRPRRRAVIEVSGRRGVAFLKVVRPPRVVSLHERHRAIVAAGVPVPQSLGYTSDGIVALQAIPGRSLREALRTGDRRHPASGAIVELLDRLPDTLLQRKRRDPWPLRASHYAAVLGATLPAQAARAAELAAEIATAWSPQPIVPVHGDFYESQLHIVDGRIAGLLDVDTAGPGERVDDFACLLGHLSVLALVHPRRAATINALGARYLAAFERNCPADELRVRVAAVVLSLATGPYRVQEPHWPDLTTRRLLLARQWLDSARATRGDHLPGHETTLTASFAGSHAGTAA